MKALRCVARGVPLHGVQLPDPIPDAGWVVVGVEVAGLCHSDVHVIDGVIEPTRRLPFTLGHVAAGTVASVGEGVEDYAIGDRVTVAIIAHPEVRAHHAPGIGVDGAYAEMEATPSATSSRHLTDILPQLLAAPIAPTGGSTAPAAINQDR